MGQLNARVCTPNFPDSSGYPSYLSPTQAWVKPFSLSFKYIALTLCAPAKDTFFAGTLDENFSTCNTYVSVEADPGGQLGDAKAISYANIV